MSDREKAGLRGPVKVCTQDQTALDARSQGGELKFSTTTEYDRDGRVLITRSTWANGLESTHARAYDAEGRLIKDSWNQAGNTNETVYTYDAGGRLLKTISSRAGARIAESVYSYDATGRLLSITTSGEHGSRATFQYDEQGRKTRIQSFDSRPLPPNVAFGGTPFQAAELGHAVPPGGHVKTVYDEHDQPTEAQVYDADGHLLSRVVLVYDAEGRIIDEKQILEDPASVIPPDMRDKILAESGRSLEELREYLGTLLGGKQGLYAASRKYDAQGRVTEVRTGLGPDFEQVVTTTYNDHGDMATEEHADTRPAARDSGSATSMLPPRPPRHFETRYEYLYDSLGNWTEQTIKSRSNPDEPFKVSSTSRRKITYY